MTPSIFFLKSRLRAEWVRRKTRMVIEYNIYAILLATIVILLEGVLTTDVKPKVNYLN
jgi:hypothetical protein